MIRRSKDRNEASVSEEDLVFLEKFKEAVPAKSGSNFAVYNAIKNSSSAVAASDVKVETKIESNHIVRQAIESLLDIGAIKLEKTAGKRTKNFYSLTEQCERLGDKIEEGFTSDFTSKYDAESMLAGKQRLALVRPERSESDDNLVANNTNRSKKFSDKFHRKLKILLVSDNEQITEEIKKIQSEGYDFNVTCSKLKEKHDAGVVIIDSKGRTEEEVLELIRQSYLKTSDKVGKSVNIIVIGDEENRIFYLASGANGFLATEAVKNLGGLIVALDKFYSQKSSALWAK